MFLLRADSAAMSMATVPGEGVTSPPISHIINKEYDGFLCSGTALTKRLCLQVSQPIFVTAFPHNKA